MKKITYCSLEARMNDYMSMFVFRGDKDRVVNLYNGSKNQYRPARLMNFFLEFMRRYEKSITVEKPVNE